MCLECKPIDPKDSTWWDDMDRDAQEYLESLEQEANNETD